MNFCFYSKYNGKSTIEQLRRVTFLFPPRHFILSITHCRSFASNNSSSICSANHFAVLCCSTSTTFNLLRSFFAILRKILCGKNTNYSRKTCNNEQIHYKIWPFSLPFSSIETRNNKIDMNIPKIS